MSSPKSIGTAHFLDHCKRNNKSRCSQLDGHSTFSRILKKASFQNSIGTAHFLDHCKRQTKVVVPKLDGHSTFSRSLQSRCSKTSICKISSTPLPPAFPCPASGCLQKSLPSSVLFQDCSLLAGRFLGRMPHLDPASEQTSRSACCTALAV